MSEAKIVYKINVDTKPFLRQLKWRGKIALFLINIASWVSRTTLTVNIEQEK